MEAENSELQTAWNNAYSLRNDERKGAYIGTITKGTREYAFYKTNSGTYQYESHTKGENHGR